MAVFGAGARFTSSKAVIFRLRAENVHVDHIESFSTLNSNVSPFDDQWSGR
jgi:hypothetical protein